MRILRRLKVILLLPFVVSNFIQLIYYRFLDKESKLIKIKLRNGLNFYARTKTEDIDIFLSIFILRDYPIHKNIQLILDLGGHIGYFSIFQAFYCRKAVIYSFEPIKDNCELFEKNLELNEHKIKNIHLIKKGIWTKEESELEIIKYSRLTGNHSFVNRDSDLKNYSSKEYVETVELTNFINKNEIKGIDYLKMDIEGAEFPVLYQINKNYPEFFNAVRYIYLEYHNQVGIDNPNDVIKSSWVSGKLIEVLKNRGYIVQDSAFSPKSGIFKCVKN